MTSIFDQHYTALDIARDDVARAFTFMVQDRTDANIAAYEAALDRQTKARAKLGRAIRDEDARQCAAAGIAAA